MRTRMYGGVRGRKTKVGGKPTFVFLLLDYKDCTVPPQSLPSTASKARDLQNDALSPSFVR